MTGPAAMVFAGLAGLAVAFQVAMLLGAPWGQLTMGGRWSGRLPPAGRIAAALSALLLTIMALAVAGQGGLIAWAPPRWAIWAVAALMAASVVMHIATPSRAERRLWLPVVSLMAVAALAVAVSAA